ncbi:alpha/beta hydrolase [Natronosporangium hydrolyticum]|uniref:Alpha/beta hydrolase n=2 Tax=Natronosporangium hydrolyticum TaxID=2811111 RepID=A0A895YNM0_9ACTN|nr:alpha/beta hydrolase [Natronosporangium hydrolyticum]QSB17535.1 alpha/beta hydrolase [Natronosporangium hydrolyticum]
MLAPESVLPDLTEPLSAWPGRLVRVDGSLTYARAAPPTGADPAPAVYVHGLGGSSTNWTDLAALLAGHLDADAIDLPGSGHSDPAGEYRIRSFAARVVRWIEEVRGEPVHLVGNSLGGTVSVVVAATRPDLIRSLTLISPALPFLDPRRSLQSRMVPLLAVPGGEWVARRLLASMSPEELAQRVVAACFAAPERVPDERFAEAVAEMSMRFTVDHYVPAYLATMRGLVGSFLRAYLPGSGSLWRTLARIEAPTLVIAGRQDRLVDIRVAPRAAELIPDSRLLILDGVGHVGQMEAPRLVARAVVSMLDEVVGRPLAGVAD